LAVADLKALPNCSVDVTLVTAAGERRRHTFPGIPLTLVLQAIAPPFSPDRDARSRSYVVVTRSDDYAATVA
jgi:hypothetical protein